MIDDIVFDALGLTEESARKLPRCLPTSLGED